MKEKKTGNLKTTEEGKKGNILKWGSFGSKNKSQPD